MTSGFEREALTDGAAENGGFLCFPARIAPIIVH
jgi:hypothetical protein